MEIVKYLKHDNRTEIECESFEEAPRSSYVYFICESCGKISSRQKTRFKGDESDGLCKSCKTNKTVFDKYGVDNISNIDGASEKKKETMFKNYGNNNQNIINGRKTLLEKYGVDNALKLKEVKQKAVRTLQEKNFDSFRCNNFDDLEALFSFEEYNGISRENEYPFRCKNCGTEFLGKINKGKPRCPTCFPPSVFRAEEEIAKFLEQYTEVIRNDRTILEGQEIDVFLPEYNIGIEHNGLYWHSEQKGKGKKYHIDKQSKAAEKDVFLIHVFENEWEFKRDIVKSILLNKIGVYDKTIYGRKTELKEISVKERRDFFNETHIQGDSNASIQYGLYYEGELVSVMSFGKSRFSKKNDWELIRFANKLNYKVHGSFSKLLKAFKRSYEGKIITYADKRYFNGNVYEKNGFTYLHDSNPNYWYYKEHSLRTYSRVKFQKHKLEKLLENFDPVLTEYENMVLNGYDRIWDCGNHVYVM